MNEAAVEHYKRAMGLYGEGKHLEAIEAYRAGLEAAPDWADCMQGLGMAQLQAGLLDEALATLRRVVELAPNDPLAHTSLSMACVRKGDIEGAEDAQAKARQLAWAQENPGVPPPAGN